MAYDSRRKRIILYGGRDTGIATFDDTWAFDGVTWTQLTPATVPPRRIFHTMTYDPVRDRVVMFGGSGSLGSLFETWEFDGTNWLLAAPTTSPTLW